MQQTKNHITKQNFQKINFSTCLDEIWDKINRFNPSSYAKTRNYINGDVSYLSPYISRGVISTRQIYDAIKRKSYNFSTVEKFIQELAWRDFWQQLGLFHLEKIESDLKHTQHPVISYDLPKNIIDATTQIKSIDDQIKSFYQSGYLHNHMRMYIAMLTCNIYHFHWKRPAQWMYYHLLDADWASNFLSWQWVCGSNSSKKYIANQDNINKYTGIIQKNTYLDCSYEELEALEIKASLRAKSTDNLETVLPVKMPINIDENKPVALYNFYNLDPLWLNDKEMNRVLILEPDHFDKYPISEKSVQFMLDLSNNIEGIQVYVGNFSELKTSYTNLTFHFKEHPLNRHYEGVSHNQERMIQKGIQYASFYRFWNANKNNLKF